MAEERVSAYLSLYFLQGNSDGLSKDTKRGFLYPQFVPDSGVVTRDEDWPDSPTVKQNEGKEDTKWQNFNSSARNVDRQWRQKNTVADRSLNVRIAAKE